MRIVSLTPAATEWLFALGAGPDLVGRSHACDAPPEARTLPVLTRTPVDAEADTAAVNEAVRTGRAAASPLHAVDTDALARLAPDLIVLQSVCGVCGVTPDDLAPALDALPKRPRLFTLRAARFKAALDEILRLGLLVGRFQETMAFIAEQEARLAGLHRAVQGSARIGGRRTGGPRVAVVEWLDPLIVAGHWAPDLIDLAGGRPALGRPGARSEVVDPAEFAAADPDVIVLAPCGFTIEQTLRDLPVPGARPEWQALRAVREGRIFALDGRAYVNRSGPGLYRAVELLAAAIDPAMQAVVQPGPREWRALGGTA